MLKIYYSINKVLLGHLKSINYDSELGSFGSIRKNNFDYIKDILKFKSHQNKFLFIYNTSPANLLTSIFSWLKGSKTIFHLHDPKPHSGLLNPVIYTIQFFQLFFSDHIILFHTQLIKTTHRYYPFFPKKKMLIFPHGEPKFKLIKIDLNNDNINFGFFGRNMPYKNVNEFVYLSNKFPANSFHIFGTGYSNLTNLNSNTRILDKFIDNDEYYSFMSKVDYVVLPYKDVSFSGIINDAISLQKKMIVSPYIMNKYSHPLMVLISEFVMPVKQELLIKPNRGWESYSSKLNQLLKCKH